MSFPLPCPESDLLRAILRGSVEPDDEERIALHLESCEQCRRTIDLISGGDGEGEATVTESHFDAVQREVSPVVVPAAVSAEPLAPELQAVMELLKDDDLGGRGASATEASEGFTRSLPSGMDAFIQHLLDKAEPGQPATIGHYELGAKIGRGGMGAVYRAYDQKLGREVAIKFLKPDLTRDGTFVERFVREAQAAAGIVHPNVVTVHSIEETDGVPWIVMELIEGESLRKRLRRYGPLTLTSVARIGAQIAEGLQAAHEKRLIHRDIKPSNIVLLEDLDEVRITDFGLAHLEGTTRLTKSGMLMGTPKYMAPEQARGEKIDHRTDLFSLGSVLYAMCTGRAPFEGKNDAEVVSNVAKHQLIPVETVDPTLPRWLTDIVTKLLAQNPEDRFQSAQEVAARLRHSLDDAEFDLATDGGWEENTAIDGSPQFHRDAAETQVERAPFNADPTRTAALATATEDLPGTTVSRPEKKRVAASTQNAVLAAGLVLLCLLIPVLAGWVDFGNGDSDELAGVDGSNGNTGSEDGSENDRAILEEFMKPLPEVGVGSVVLVQDERRRRFIDLGAAIGAALNGDVVLLEFDGEMPISQIPVHREITIAAGWNHGKNKPFEPVLKRNDFDIMNGSMYLFSIHSSVRMKGVEIHYASAFSEVQRQTLPRKQLLEWAIACQSGGQLELVNCRIRMAPGNSTMIAIQVERGSRGLTLRNSEIIGGTAVSIGSSQSVKIENSLLLGPSGLVVLPQMDTAGLVEIRNSVVICESLLHFNIGRFARNAPATSRIKVNAGRNVIDTTRALVTISQLGTGPNLLTLEQIKEFKLASLLVYGGKFNRYDTPRLVAFQDRISDPENLTQIAPLTVNDWLEHWRSRDDGSRRARFNPAVGFDGYHPDLLRISGAKELQPRLDGNLPPPHISYAIDQIGPGEGYLGFLNQTRGERSTTGETPSSRESD